MDTTYESTGNTFTIVQLSSMQRLKSTHETKTVTYLEWKATNDKFFSKMDMHKFSVKLSIGRFFCSCKAGVFSIVHDPVNSVCMTPSQHAFIS